MTETLSIIGSVCSIISLIIAVFIAGKVVKIKASLKVDNSENKKNKTNSRIRGNDNIVSGNDIIIKK